MLVFILPSMQLIASQVLDVKSLNSEGRTNACKLQQAGVCLVSDMHRVSRDNSGNMDSFDAATDYGGTG